MHRDVECIQEFAARHRSVIHLPDYMCEKPVPTRNRGCNNIDCHSEWMVGPWSQVINQIRKKTTQERHK